MTPNTNPPTTLESIANASGAAVQRVSCPVQRGVAATPPVGAADVGIVAITQNMPVRSPRRFVRLFQPRFAVLVETGKKFQTVRPTPLRAQDMPRVGDLFDARSWIGAPYRSKQRKLFSAPVPITAVTPIELCFLRCRLLIWIRGAAPRHLTSAEIEQFARADGFQDSAEMAHWFSSTHGLPFCGILIDWLPF